MVKAIICGVILITLTTLTACGGSTSSSSSGTILGGAKQGNDLILTNFVSTFAGFANYSGSADGVAAVARFSAPTGIASDGTNIYVVDSSSYTIRKIDISKGLVTTIAGTAGVCSSADGTGAAAKFSWISGITTDGTNIYVIDHYTDTIRKIAISTGVVTTVGGYGAGWSFYNNPDITTDGTNLYVAVNGGYNKINKIDISTGEVTTIAGKAGILNSFGSSDGVGAAASFTDPTGITTDGTNLYVADSENYTIRKIRISTGEVTTIAGKAGVAGSADGIGTDARFVFPNHITTDGTNLYVTDHYSYTIRKIVISTGAVTTIAGTAGAYGSADGNGAIARFRNPTGITTDGANIYVTDTGNSTIRKIQ